jgi:hypothetical protein
MNFHHMSPIRLRRKLLYLRFSTCQIDSLVEHKESASVAAQSDVIPADRQYRHLITHIKRAAPAQHAYRTIKGAHRTKPTGTTYR